MSAAEALGPEELAGAIAKELTRARQRGLDGLDLPLGTEGRVAVPHLDDLARRYTADLQTDHIPLIRRLLRDALDAWEPKGHTSEARTVRRLFFARDGGSPGRTSPSELLTQAEKATGKSAAAFEKLRRALFREFGRFLIDFVTESASVEPLVVQAVPAPAPASGQPRGRLPRRLLTELIVMLLLGITVVLLVFRPWESPPATGGSTPNRDATAGAALFTFDALGGGSSSIHVYPGVEDTPADKIPNGTFFSGQTTPTLCKTPGRRVTSDRSAGERPRSSGVWLRVLAQPGKTSYAPLTYGEMAPDALAALPQCGNVS